jgi:hypothetical protein
MLPDGNLRLHWRHDRRLRHRRALRHDRSPLDETRRLREIRPRREMRPNDRRSRKVWLSGPDSRAKRSSSRSRSSLSRLTDEGGAHGRYPSRNRHAGQPTMAGRNRVGAPWRGKAPRLLPCHTGRLAGGQRSPRTTVASEAPTPDGEPQKPPGPADLETATPTEEVSRRGTQHLKAWANQNST